MIWILYKLKDITNKQETDIACLQDQTDNAMLSYYEYSCSGMSIVTTTTNLL